jgi:hypothetical protein
MMHTVKQIAERFHVGDHAVLGWIANGELAAVNVARDMAGERPRWRISAEALERFELARMAKPPLPRAPLRRRAAGAIEFYK